MIKKVKNVWILDEKTMLEIYTALLRKEDLEARSGAWSGGSEVIVEIAKQLGE